MRIRLTMVVRNTDGIKAKFRTKVRGAKERLLVASVEQAEEMQREVERRCPQDTGYSATQVVVRFTQGGYSWTVGFWRTDFVGHVNPVTGETITSFYIAFVIRGTRFMAGNNFPAAALAARKRAILTAYRQAIKG